MQPQPQVTAAPQFQPFQQFQQMQAAPQLGGQPLFVLPGTQMDPHHHHQGPVYVVVQQPQMMNQSMSGSASTMYVPAATLAPPPSPAWGQLPPQQPFGASGTIPYFNIASASLGAAPIVGGSLTTRPMVMMPDTVSPSASLSRSLGHSTSSRPLPDVKIWGFALADAYHPSLQRVPVPPSVVRHTRGIASYNNDVSTSSTMPCSSTVCLKYSGSNATGGCPLGDACPNFHVDLAYMERARHTTDSLCCGVHNDYFTQEMIASNCAPTITNARFTLVLEDRAEIELLPAQLAFTIGLDHLSTRGSTRIINLRKQVCRLHLEGKCKWTKDCGHVHICRELHAFLQKFHYPSLIFLLMTESAEATIETKLREGAALLDFFSSKSSIPLVQQLIDAKKLVALSALVNCGAKFIQDHWDAIGVMGVSLPPSIPADRILPQVHAPIARAIETPAKAPEDRPAPDADLNMPTFSPGASLTGHPSSN